MADCAPRPAPPPPTPPLDARRARGKFVWAVHSSPAPVALPHWTLTPTPRAHRSCTAMLGLLGSLGLVALYGANVNAMQMILKFFDADMQIRA